MSLEWFSVRMAALLCQHADWTRAGDEAWGRRSKDERCVFMVPVDVFEHRCSKRISGIG